MKCILQSCTGRRSETKEAVVCLSFIRLFVQNSVMSTAHKPTWSPAAGRSSGNGNITAGGYLTGGEQ